MYKVFVHFILCIVCYMWLFTTYFKISYMRLSVCHHVSDGMEVVRFHLLFQLFPGQPVKIFVAHLVVLEVSLTCHYSAFQEEHFFAWLLERRDLVEFRMCDHMCDWDTAYNPGVHVDTSCRLQDSRRRLFEVVSEACNKE